MPLATEALTDVDADVQVKADLDVPPAIDVFPGDHGGYDGHAAEFAGKLREVLEG